MLSTNSPSYIAPLGWWSTPEKWKNSITKHSSVNQKRLHENWGSSHLHTLSIHSVIFPISFINCPVFGMIFSLITSDYNTIFLLVVSIWNKTTPHISIKFILHAQYYSSWLRNNSDQDFVTDLSYLNLYLVVYCSIKKHLNTKEESVDITISITIGKQKDSIYNGLFWKIMREHMNISLFVPTGKP